MDEQKLRQVVDLKWLLFRHAQLVLPGYRVEHLSEETFAQLHLDGVDVCVADMLVLKCQIHVEQRVNRRELGLEGLDRLGVEDSHVTASVSHLLDVLLQKMEDDVCAMRDEVLQLILKSGFSLELLVQFLNVQADDLIIEEVDLALDQSLLVE